MYFKNIKSYEDLKAQYRKLAMQNHPDMGGKVETMQEINNEYDALFIIWKRRSNVETKETAASTRSEFYTQNGWKGDNYNSNRSLKDVAKIVRNYVKLQYPTFRFSITTHYASMCQELEVYLTQAPFDIRKPKSEWNENEKLKAWRKEQEYKEDSIFYRDDVQEMFADIDSFVNSYNRSDCDSMTDYFDVDFYYFGVKPAAGDQPLKIVPRTARIGNANYRDKGITVSNSKPQDCIKQPKTTYTYTITEDTDTRDNSKIWLVKINEKLSKDEYITVKQQIKTIGGYYSRFKHAFLFKAEPSEPLKNLFKNQEQQTVNREQNTVKTAKQEQKQLDNSAIKTKIEKQIESNNKKIEQLSGDYRTNTYKRMREQDSRDAKKEAFIVDNKILNYLKSTLEERALTILESAMLVGSFRDSIHSYYLRHEAFKKPDHGTALKEICYPEYNREYPDSWWNQEVPKERKRLEKANIKNTEQLIQAVEEYGKILDTVLNQSPINKADQQIKKMERELKMCQKGDIQFTPSEIAEQIVSMAELDYNSKVLEPEAGIGNIADEIKKYTRNIDVCEQRMDFCELLKLKGYNIVSNDFLEYQPEPIYDAVIMNPPFANNQDIEHLKHAYTMLKTGGTLVCVTSPHWSFANDSKSIDFRNWLDLQDYEQQELESGTFEMTGVRSMVLVIRKHEQQEEQTA